MKADRDTVGIGDDRVTEMVACVRAAGLKVTPQRLAILRELASDPTHPTAQELFERLRPALPTMSFATVYNTLDALAGAGLCAALSLAPGAARFDPNMLPHHHAVCDRCGLVRDIPLQGAPKQEECAPGAPAGFELRAVERIYRGLCADCAREAAKGSPATRGLRQAGRGRDVTT
jgi:Fur family peroxide stress response transcriptional regulator